MIKDYAHYKEFIILKYDLTSLAILHVCDSRSVRCHCLHEHSDCLHGESMCHDLNLGLHSTLIFIL